MGTLTHKAARAAYGTAIDAVLKHVNWIHMSFVRLH